MPTTRKQLPPPPQETKIWKYAKVYVPQLYHFQMYLRTLPRLLQTFLCLTLSCCWYLRTAVSGLVIENAKTRLKALKQAAWASDVKLDLKDPCFCISKESTFSCTWKRVFTLMTLLAIVLHTHTHDKNPVLGARFSQSWRHNNNQNLYKPTRGNARFAVL